MGGIDTVDRCEDVVFNLVFLQQTQAAHDPIKGRSPAFVHTIHIVQVAWAVNADADQEVVFFKEGAPGIIQQGAVGLEGVFQGHSRPAVPFSQDHSLTEEIQAHQGGFAPLPGDGDLVGLVGFDQLPDIGFKQLLAHAELAVGIERFFIQEEAVGAVQVAGRAGGLGQQVEGRGGIGRNLQSIL